MEFRPPQFSPSELFGDLKDRISGNRNRQPEYDNYYSDEYYEGYPEVDDYDVYNYDEDSSRSGGRFGRTTYVRNDGYGARSPQLVSSEDIRATTSAYGVEPAYTRVDDSPRPLTSSSPAAQRIAALGQSARESLSNMSPFSTKKEKQEEVFYDEYNQYGDDYVDEFEEMATPASSISDFSSPFQKQSSAVASAPAPQPTPKPQGVFGAQLEPNHKSAGLESLFVPSESEPAQGSRSPLYASDYTNPVVGSGREILVVEPAGFHEAETIATAVRAGKIVVLALKVSGPDLSKRILDFSFGVAAALDARIECVAPDVFTLNMGEALTLEEKHRLRRQGVM